MERAQPGAGGGRYHRVQYLLGVEERRFRPWRYNDSGRAHDFGDQTFVALPFLPRSQQGVAQPSKSDAPSGRLASRNPLGACSADRGGCVRPRLLKSRPSLLAACAVTIDLHLPASSKTWH